MKNKKCNKKDPFFRERCQLPKNHDDPFHSYRLGENEVKWPDPLEPEAVWFSKSDDPDRWTERE